MTLEQLQLSNHARQRAEQRYINFERVVNKKEFKIIPDKKNEENIVQVIVKYNNSKSISLVVNVVSMVVLTVLIVR